MLFAFAGMRRLGLNAAQTTLGAIAQLTGATVVPVTSSRGN